MEEKYIFPLSCIQDESLCNSMYPNMHPSISFLTNVWKITKTVSFVDRLEENEMMFGHPKHSLQSNGHSISAAANGNIKTMAFHCY